MTVVGGGFNRSPQHTLRTSLLVFDIARSFVAAHSVGAQVLKQLLLQNAARPSDVGRSAMDRKE